MQTREHRDPEQDALDPIIDGGAVKRLSAFDLMFLRLETPEWPCHFGGLAIVDGETLLDETGQLQIPQISERLEPRLTNVPQLRRRLLMPGPLGGRPLWVDDPRFQIDRHVFQTPVAFPGGDAELLAAAAHVCEKAHQTLDLKQWLPACRSLPPPFAVRRMSSRINTMAGLFHRTLCKIWKRLYYRY